MTGKHLQNIMYQEGYTVNRMAQLIGRSQQVLASALKHDDVRTGLLEDIAQAMGKPLAFFYGEPFNAVQSASGNNNTQVSGNSNTVNSDSGLMDLLRMKEEQLTLAMQQTSKAQAQMDRVLDRLEGN